MKILDTLMKSSNGEILNRSEIRTLMTIEPDSVAFYWLLAAAGHKATGDGGRDKALAIEALTWKR